MAGRLTSVSDWRSLCRELFHDIRRDLEAVLADIRPELLDSQVEPGTNTIGWLAWHLTRSHDRNVSEVRGTPQLWISQGWYARFGRAPDPGETGFGHTPDQLAAFRSPAPAVLVGYHHAVVGMVEDYLGTAPEGDLTRESTSPTLHETRSVEQRMAGVLVEGLEHVGQMAFLRGVLDRRGPGTSRGGPGDPGDATPRR
jgi:hypothetical protein